MFDRVAPIAQDAVLAVELGDRARGGRGGHQGRVVEPEPWEHLAPGGGVNTSIDDRYLGGLAGAVVGDRDAVGHVSRSEEHTSELQSLMRISYAVFCLKKKKKTK